MANYIICLSFIGKTQSYLEDCVYQIRLFTNVPIYYIYDDYGNDIVNKLYNKYNNIFLIKYEEVICKEFNILVNENIGKFHIVDNIGDRKELFIRSFERFYLLYNLCIKYHLENVLFLELDNLIYDDPINWFNNINEKKLCYMIDHHIDKKCASGIFFMKNILLLKVLIDYFTYFILNNNGFMSEMIALYEFYEKYSDSVYILQTHDSILPYSLNYKNTLNIYDAAAIGVYLFGYDKCYTNGTVVKNLKNIFSYIDYTSNKFVWIEDYYGRKIPYILKDCGGMIRINNLHIHSKTLNEALSKMST